MGKLVDSMVKELIRYIGGSGCSRQNGLIVLTKGKTGLGTVCSTGERWCELKVLRGLLTILLLVGIHLFRAVQQPAGLAILGEAKLLQCQLSGTHGIKCCSMQASCFGGQNTANHGQSKAQADHLCIVLQLQV